MRQPADLASSGGHEGADDDLALHKSDPDLLTRDFHDVSETMVDAAPKARKQRRRTARLAKGLRYAFCRKAPKGRRQSVQNLIDGFNLLRAHVPSYPSGRQLTQIETLRLAILYIKDLTELVCGDEVEQQLSETTVDIASEISSSTGLPLHGEYDLLTRTVDDSAQASRQECCQFPWQKVHPQSMSATIACLRGVSVPNACVESGLEANACARFGAIPDNLQSQNAPRAFDSSTTNYPSSLYPVSLNLFWLETKKVLQYSP